LWEGKWQFLKIQLRKGGGMRERKKISTLKAYQCGGNCDKKVKGG